MWIEQFWIDATLMWDPAEFGNITTIRMPSKLIWRPGTSKVQ